MSRPHRARKRFGQHFLTATNVVSDIVSSVAATSDDTLVEIGPGPGALTIPLAATGAELHAIEFDRDLVAPLRKRFAGVGNVTIHEADALAFDYSTLGDDLRIVSNLPYNISTPVLFRLIEYRSHIRDLHLMLQKEVVNRMAASPGSKSFGRLSIMLGCHMQVHPLFDVPPEAFSPPPKVVSAVVALRPLPEATYRITDPKSLAMLVTTAFSQRRKTVRNALKSVVNEDLLTGAGIDPSARPEQIPIDNWVQLANAFVSTD
jgi:16S rRNA (adenine1518-N6/adenine1519-N6)-dimethyltransferase